MVHSAADMRERLDAAKALMPCLHPKCGENGKKDKGNTKAKTVAKGIPLLKLRMGINQRMTGCNGLYLGFLCCICDTALKNVWVLFGSMRFLTLENKKPITKDWLTA